MTLRKHVKQMLDLHPDWTNRDIAEAIGCSKRSVRRYANPYRRVETKTAKILLFDIETAPLEVYTWSLWPKSISYDNVIKDWSILSWSAKWLFDSNIMSQVVSPSEARARLEGSVLQGIWDLLNEADIVIAHNGVKFDVRKLNTKFALYGMPPPMPYRVIDTMKVARKAFSFASNSLDYLTRQLTGERKITTTFNLWLQCMDGDTRALKQMVEYNRKDVVIMEELYIKIRPWITSHPNIGLYIDTDSTVCTNCGNTNLTWNGHYHTPAGRYEAFRCNSCGAIGRSRIADMDTDERRRLAISVAR